MLPPDWFDYPPFPHQEPSPAMKELYEKTRERLNASRVKVITAKEGGGTREFVAGVDNYLSIYHTTPGDRMLSMQVGKHRGHGNSPADSPFVYDIGKIITD